MQPENVKVLDRNSVVEAIKNLNEADLSFLNHLIVERLKLISQAKSTRLMADFCAGDRICFQGPDGQLKKGIILRLNKKTASIRTDDGHMWNVHPGFLRKQ